MTINCALCDTSHYLLIVTGTAVVSRSPRTLVHVVYRQGLEVPILSSCRHGECNPVLSVVALIHFFTLSFSPSSTLLHILLHSLILTRPSSSLPSRSSCERHPRAAPPTRPPGRAGDHRENRPAQGASCPSFSSCALCPMLIIPLRFGYEAPVILSPSLNLHHLHSHSSVPLLLTLQDVDGLHPLNVAQLANTKTHAPGRAAWSFDSIGFHVSCTPQVAVSLPFSLSICVPLSVPFLFI